MDFLFRKLAIEFTLSENGDEQHREPEEPISEEDVLALLKETFDAREVDDR